LKVLLNKWSQGPNPDISYTFILILPLGNKLHKKNKFWINPNSKLHVNNENSFLSVFNCFLCMWFEVLKLHNAYHNYINYGAWWKKGWSRVWFLATSRVILDIDYCFLVCPNKELGTCYFYFWVFSLPRYMIINATLLRVKKWSCTIWPLQWLYRWGRVILMIQPSQHSIGVYKYLRSPTLI